MSQRLHNTTKWFWSLLILYSGPNWNPVRCVAVRTPPSNPSVLETQAKFFQDFFSVQLSPYKIEFGHVCEDPNTWEQRYEKKDFKNHRDMGKIRWGDKKGGYGEHYWDLNHAGHTGDHGDDDGSYRERDSGDSYDEPSDQSSNYDTAGYDSENNGEHDDSGREKRAPRRIRMERAQDKEEMDEEKPQDMRRLARKQKEKKEVVNDDSDDSEQEENAEQEVYRKQAKQQQRRPQKDSYATEENKETKEKNQVVLVVDEKEKDEKPVRYVQRNPEAKVFVPYEGGAGVRQHYQAEITPAASVPRLFLEPATGHVVDRATGQAYVLQPINRNPTYS